MTIKLKKHTDRTAEDGRYYATEDGRFQVHRQLYDDGDYDSADEWAWWTYRVRPDGELDLIDTTDTLRDARGVIARSQ